MSTGPEIVARLTMNADQFSKGIKKAFDGVGAEADRAAEEVGTKMGEKIGKNIGKGIAIGTAGIAAIGAATVKALEYAAAIGDVAQQAGVGAEELQKLRFAASKTGVEQDRLDDGLRQLTRTVGEAIDGNKRYRREFADLNIGLVDTKGNARATGDVFREVARELSKIEDPAKRARIEAILFGEAGQRLDGLLSGGVDQIDNLSRAAEEAGVVLSTKEIQEADITANKLNAVSKVLQARIAKEVAANAEAIYKLADSFLNMGGALAQWWSQKPEQAYALLGAAAGGRVGGVPGAVVGGATGALGGAEAARRADDGNMDLKYRAKRAKDAVAQFDASVPDLAGGGVARIRRDGEGVSRSVALREVERQTVLLRRARVQFDLERVSVGEVLAKPPAPGGFAVLKPDTKTPKGRKPDKSDAEKEAERAAKEAERAAKAALRDFERMEESVGRRLGDEQRGAEIDRLRAAGLDHVADREQAIARVRAVAPDLLNKEASQVAAIYGIDQKRARALLDQLQTLESIAGQREDERYLAEQIADIDREGLNRQRERFEEAQRADREAVENMRRVQEEQLLSLSDLYGQMFRGQTGDIWQDFKDAGIDAVTDIAARWTLALITGGKAGLEGMPVAVGRSPLGNLLGSISAGGGTSGGLAGFGGSLFGGGAASNPMVQRLMGNGMSIKEATSAAKQAGALGSSGFGGILGSVGSALPYIGAAAGLFGMVSGLFKSTPYTSGDRVSSGTGDSKTSGVINATRDQLAQIAEALGANLDLSRSDVVIGTYGNDFRVSTKGFTGKMKYADGNKGIQNTGSDADATIRLAVREMILDGVLTGISQASQNILRKSGDLESAIEKAVMIEQVPKLLRERLDPLGASLDAIDAKFRKLADALREGGASAEQIAEARQLWQLERADAIKSVRESTGTLNEYLKSLRLGSDSPLSLRTQQAEAEAALAPFIEQIRAARDARAGVAALDARRAAGGVVSDSEYEAAVKAARAAAAAVDQEGYANASSTLLGLERQINGSTGAFFQRYDQIESLTRDAIGLIEKAVPKQGEAADPFGSAIAQSTKATASILDGHTELLREISRKLGGGSGGTVDTGFLYENRLFADAR